MKRLILILLAFTFTQMANAQKADTTYFELKEQIVEMQNELDIMQKDYGQKINNIKIDMTNFNKQFRKGTNVMFVGVLSSITAVLLANYNPEPKNTQTKNLITGLAIGGAAFTLGGALIQIDSFKYLGGSHSLTVRMSFNL